MMPDPPHTPSGILVVDKPAGWTSHDVVSRSRSLLGIRKVGHSGTLDPGATGVLVLGIGRATRLLRFLTALPKEYRAKIVFGTETSTLDAGGEVTANHDMSQLDPTEVLRVAAEMTGVIFQVPPMVSALKVGGRKLYEIAREGKEVERSPRRVNIYRFDLLPTEDALIWKAEVECSSGTYVRSLAADLGSNLGGGAHLAELRRLAVGTFTLDDARPIEISNILPPSAAVSHLEKVCVDGDIVSEVGFGRVMDLERLNIEGMGPWAIHDQNGELLAVYEAYGERAKPSVVLRG